MARTRALGSSIPTGLAWTHSVTLRRGGRPGLKHGPVPRNIDEVFIWANYSLVIEDYDCRWPGKFEDSPLIQPCFHADSNHGLGEISRVSNPELRDEIMICVLGWWMEELLHHSKDGWNPTYNGINHPSTGAGFLPSTVSLRKNPEKNHLLWPLPSRGRSLFEGRHRVGVVYASAVPVNAYLNQLEDRGWGVDVVW